MKVLLTGFENWEGSKGSNPSGAIVKALENAPGIDGVEIVGFFPPVDFHHMVASVMDEIDRVEPDAVIMMGEFPGRAVLTVERLAQNLIDASRYGLSDNSGNCPIEELIDKNGPVAHQSTLPVRAMTLEMRSQGVPSDISDTAGTFGCNCLFYGVLNELAKRKSDVKAGWIHNPILPDTACLPENIGQPSMALDLQIKGIQAAIKAIKTNPKQDVIKAVSGRLQI